jgi:hypothetical protein
LWAEFDDCRVGPQFWIRIQKFQSSRHMDNA